jgi:hypothetical protein
MAAYKEQCAKQKSAYRNSFRWIKRSMSRYIRRMAKRDPEEAWRKHYYWGYYS